MKQAVIIFQKNPKEGHTKTRLAFTVGHANAMLVYAELVRHAHEVVAQINADKFLYFSDFVEEDSRWVDYSCYVQSTGDLGVRMKSALDDVLAKGYDKVVLIGTDCYHLTSSILNESFNGLGDADYCIGPATDGGYYLIGAKETHSEVLLDKEWSTSTVFQEAVDAIKYIRKKLYILPTLSDVDTEEDLGELRKFLEI